MRSMDGPAQMRLWKRTFTDDKYEFWALATYNGERARGIMHTPEWQEKMAADQERFDAQQNEKWAKDTHVIVIGDSE